MKPFYVWALQFKTEDSALGDLVRDAIKANEGEGNRFPWGSHDRNQILQHLESHYDTTGKLLTTEKCVQILRLATFKSSWIRYAIAQRRVYKAHNKRKLLEVVA